MATTKATDDKLPPMQGGVTPKEEDNTPHAIFDTSGSEPVRDRSPDDSKGRPVERFFTKDGTPVEPSSVPPTATPAHLQGHDASKDENVVSVWEYLDDEGNVLSHDTLEAKRSEDKKRG